MIKEFITDTLESDGYSDPHLAWRSEYISNRRSFLNNRLKRNRLFTGKSKSNPSEFSSLQKLRIVVNGLIGNISIDRLCLEEGISIDDYTQWRSDFLKAFKEYSDKESTLDKLLDKSKELILKETNEEVYSFFKKYFDISFGKVLVIPKDENFSELSSLYTSKNILFLKRINDFRKINKHLENVNENIPKGGILMGCFQTFKSGSTSRNTIVNKIPVFRSIYLGFEFLFKRVFPKLPYIKKMYFFITKGKNRHLSKAEALGRIVSCGFEILEFKEINGIHYFAARKIKTPSYDMNPSYGPLFKMKRVGKNGKIIGVYKFRTMHPYSEYLQEYILKLNGYSETGKPADDFRVVPWGKFLRRYWLDELPQLINVFKGELKLVGIRPVSKTYFDTSIPKDIQQLRLTQKPGCIPPYVALNRNSSVDSVLEAEREYLKEKNKNPYLTDTKYFLRAIYNIFFKGKRSA